MKTGNILLTTIIFLLTAVNADAQLRTVHAEWNHQSFSELEGFRLYHENSFACEILNPAATSIDCDLNIADGETWFTVTSLFSGNIESPHSNQISYTFTSGPQAVISASQTEGYSQLTIEFNAESSTGDISSYAWSFGDGEIGAGSTITHIFKKAGIYTTTLLVTDASGSTDEDTIVITVEKNSTQNIPPKAIIKTNTSVATFTPVEVVLDGSDSYDVDGDITSYRWTMGDGTVLTGQQITHTYTTPGTYYPTLTVTDDLAATDTISTPVIIIDNTDTNAAPTAVITATKSRGASPLEVTFYGTNSTDKDGSIASYSWDFGDGSTGSGATIKHTFTQPAIYSITLTVTDNQGTQSAPARYTINATDEENRDMSSLISIINLLLLDSD